MPNGIPARLDRLIRVLWWRHLRSEGSWHWPGDRGHPSSSRDPTLATNGGLSRCHVHEARSPPYAGV